MKCIKITKINTNNIDISIFNDSIQKHLSNKHDKNLIESFNAWKLLLDSLKEFNVNLNDYEVLFDEDGKPYIKDNPFYFSLSHSHEYVLIGINDKPIGVDIELIIDLHVNLKVAKKIGFNYQNPTQFFMEFAKYEAYYKATKEKSNDKDCSEIIYDGYAIAIYPNDKELVNSFDKRS